jgi:hypothetical protein
LDEVAINHWLEGCDGRECRLIQHGVLLGLGDAAEAVEGIDFGVAARCVDDGAVSGLVEAGVAVGDVVHWVAGFHDTGAEEVVVATSIGHQMDADAVSSCGFAPDCDLVGVSGDMLTIQSTWAYPRRIIAKCSDVLLTPMQSQALVTKTKVSVATALDLLRLQEAPRSESVPDRDANDTLSNLNRILNDE